MTTGQTVRLRLGAARHDRERDFPLPPGWRVTVYPPRDRPAMTDGDIRASLDSPVGAEPISRLARGAQSAVLLVDDFRRPTPAETLCLAVIDQLHTAGLRREQITIILGNGAHRAMTPREVRARLGAAHDLAGQVISHFAYDADVTFLGITPDGTPVLVNEAAARADFSVTISTVYPHPLVTWGGGAKMVLPGISHISTIHYHHGRMKGGPRAGAPRSCASRRDLEAAADLFGLDYSLCAVVNSRKQMCGLFAGEPTAAHRRAIALARRVGETVFTGEPPDLVIANAYPLDADGTQYTKAQEPVRQFSCPVLMLSDFADPSTYHGLYDGPPGPYRRLPKPAPPPLTEELLTNARVFMYSPQYGDGFVPKDRSWYGDSDWGRLMDAMARRFPRATVAVFPVAPLQLVRAGDGA